MKFKSLISISLLFLLVFNSFPALALDGDGEGRVKILDSDGNVRSDSIQKSENFAKPSNNDDVEPVEQAIEADPTQFTVTDSGMQAGEAMLVNAGMNLSYNIADQFLLSGIKINSLQIEEKKASDSGSITYSVLYKELNPFGVPFVNKILGVTGGIYFICMILIGALAYISFAVQSNFPTWFSKIRMELTGEEGFFNINDVFTVWGSEICGPVGTFAFIFFVANARDLLVSGMATDIVTTIASTSDSLPNYFLVCAGIYFNGVQRLVAQFGVFYFIAMVFIQWIIADLIAVFISVQKAAGLVIFSHIYFILLVLVDIVTVFLIWFGVQLVATTGIEAFSLVSILVAFGVDLFLILSMPLYIVLQLYTRTRSISIVGF